MSDPVVIAVFESQLQTLSTPYIETLNSRPSALPPSYTSLELDYATVDRITIGKPDSQFRETGTLTVVCAVQSGIGRTAASALTEQVRELFHNFSLEHLQVLTVGSGAVFDPDEGNFFQLKVPVQYQFDFFR